jgi:hypothetical protein
MGIIIAVSLYQERAKELGNANSNVNSGGVQLYISQVIGQLTPMAGIPVTQN